MGGGPKFQVKDVTQQYVIFNAISVVSGFLRNGKLVIQGL